MTKLYSGTQHLPPLFRSDHQGILLAPLHQLPHSRANSRLSRKLKPENVRSLGLKLDMESWEAVFAPADVDAKVEAFNAIITDALDTCAPLGPVRMHPNDKEWMTPHIKNG